MRDERKVILSTGKGSRNLAVAYKVFSLEKFGIFLFLPVLKVLEVVDEFSLLEIALLS